MKVAIALLMLTFSVWGQVECSKELAASFQSTEAKFQLPCNSSEFISCTRMVAIDASCESDPLSSINEVQLQENLTVVRIFDVKYKDEKCESLKSQIFKCVDSTEMEYAEYVVAKINNFRVDTDGHEIIRRAPAIEIGERIEEEHKKEQDLILPELEIKAKPE